MFQEQGELVKLKDQLLSEQVRARDLTPLVLSKQRELTMCDR